MKYEDYKRNHVILPGQEKALEEFINKGFKGMKHKKRNAFSSNSEDALTWSCFNIISQMPFSKKLAALDEILEDAFQDEKCNFKFKDRNYKEDEIHIFIGKTYKVNSKKEETEVDASIELPDKLIFFEAKLYSSISLIDISKNMPYDQIVRKLRIGLDCANHENKEYYFIFIDIAPARELLKFTKDKNKKKAMDPSKEKWKSAWWFNYYKKGHKKSLQPLKKVLVDITHPPISEVSRNMGWLTWTDLFKIVMRGML